MSEVHETTLELPSDFWIVPILLLLLRERSSYGQDLAVRAVDLGFEDIRPDAAYRLLRLMERDGLVLSESDGSGGIPPRREYAITGAGEAYLEFWANSLAQYRRPVDRFLEVYVGKAVREEAHIWQI